MCKQVKESKQVNAIIYVVVFMACVSAAGLAYATEIPITPLDAAERMEKLSAMGVLAFCLLSSLGALTYLIKLQYGRMMTVIDRNAEATQQSIDMTKVSIEATQKMLVAMEKCDHRHSHEGK